MKPAPGPDRVRTAHSARTLSPHDPLQGDPSLVPLRDAQLHRDALRRPTTPPRERLHESRPASLPTVNEYYGERISRSGYHGIPAWTVAVGGVVGAVMAAELCCYGVEATIQWLAGNRKRGAENGYLEGNFAPVKEETAPCSDGLRVEGTLPLDLAGVFARVGPNPKEPAMGNYHWFDGDGMVHAVRIQEGRVTYTSHWVQTSKLLQEKKLGWAAYPKIGDLTGITGMVLLALGKMKQLAGVIRGEKQGSGCANTALVFHAGKLLALHEADLPYALRMTCEGMIETMGRVTYGLDEDAPFTAHPKVDPDTGDLHYFGYNIMNKPYCNYSVADKAGVRIKSVQIDIPDPVMMHDFAITTNYAIFVDCPLVFNPEVMVRKGVVPFEYKGERGTRVGLLRRDFVNGERTQWFTLPSFMAFHVANAWEETRDGQGPLVHMFLCSMKTFDLNVLSEPTDLPDLPKLHHIVMDTDSGEVSDTCMSNLAMDFPQIHAAAVGKPCKYAYGAVMPAADQPGKAGQFVGIAKMDLSAKGVDEDDDAVVAQISYGAGRYGGEAVFVPRFGHTNVLDAGCDEGFLVTYVFDEVTGASEMVIYDAKTMSSKPVASIHLNRRVPFGFHAIWIDAEKLKTQLHSLAADEA